MIDPATAKALAQAAAKILTDKETRNKLLYIILIAIASGVIILLIPIYILTHPVEMLKAVFADTPDDAAFVEQFKTENDEKVLVIGEGLSYEGFYPLPVKEAEIEKEYGENTAPGTGEISFHYGTDFRAAWQSEIFAVADGEVIDVCTEQNDGYGDYLIIRHTGQRTNESGETETEYFYAMYAGMSEIYMFKGQEVKQGAVIGLLGNIPDESAQGHLHFEIRETQDGAGINPAGYIFPEQEPEETEPKENTESEVSADEQQEKAG